MLTLEQIKNVQFTKVRGGYKDEEVDDFIDQCVATVSGLIEERNASNKKLEVLADKLVEYRNDEDSIRAALVNAQRLGDTIVREANQKASLVQEDANIKAEKMLAEAEEKAKSTLGGIAEEVESQQNELDRLKKEVSLFKSRMLSIYREHLALIDILPEEKPEEKVEEEATEAPAEETAPVAEKEIPEPEKEEEPSIEEAFAEAVEEAAEEAVEEELPAIPVGNVPLMAGDPDEQPTEEKDDAPKSRFGDLKFGTGYVIADDADDDPKENKGFFKRKK